MLDNIPSLSLREWQEMIGRIYGEKDRRDYTPEGLLLHVVEEAAKIDEGLLKESRKEILTALPGVFIWFVSFCFMIDMDLEHPVWSKYHGCCPYCGEQRNCICIAQETKPTRWYRVEDIEPPDSLDALQTMFGGFYRKVNRLVSSEKIWLHFHEELGEVSQAYRFQNTPEGREKLSYELADAFAWLLAMCTRLEVELNGLAYRTYPGVCDTCKEPKCVCPKV